VELGAAGSGANGAAQAPQGQQDYSAEWAEYYRRIGKTDEAEAIEKQIQQTKVSPIVSIPEISLR
jgi:far upstream element-binding protein